MPVGINSPARNLFLLGSSGQAAVTNFFETVDQSAGTDGVYLPAEIKYIFSNQKYALAGSAQDSNAVSFGWFERQDYDIETGLLTTDYTNEVVNTQSLPTSLFAMELDANENLIVGGKTGDVPWIAKYSNDGVLDWQSTTNSADVEYSGIASNSSGNYYACGSTQSSNPQQAFVEKFDANGNPGWGKSAFMLGRHVMLDAIDANSRGQVVAVGHLEDDSYIKGYIVKIDTNTGEVLWDRTLDAGGDITLGDVFIDSNDQIYIVGTSLGPAVEGYIFKYTAEGNLIWQRKTNGSSLDNFTFDRVKSDGETEQTIVFGTYFDMNGNDLGGVLSKYAKDGSLVWRRTIFSSNNNSDSFSDVCLDADPSFYYLMYVDTEIDGLVGTPDSYTFGKVSSSGNGLGGFQYAEGTGETIDYQILNIGDTISRVSDGAVRNDSSDLITYPFTGNKIVFDDLSTQVTNKKRQMDAADSFEYSGSPAVRPTDFQELNLLGEIYSGSGDWLDQSGKGNHVQVSDQEPFSGIGAIKLKNASADFYEVPYSDEFILGTEWTIEFYIKAISNRNSKLIGTRGDSAPNGWEIVYKNGQIGIEQYGDETTSGQQRTSEVLPVGTWTHVAVVNYNGGVKIYYDGVDTGFNWTGSSGSTWPAGGSHPLRIGKPTSYNEGPDVLMSNIRIVTGSAIYTSAFNPPSLPLTNTGQTTVSGTDYYTGSEWSPAGINAPEDAFTAGNAGSGGNGGNFGPFTYTFANPVTGVTSARIRGALGASVGQVGGTTNVILVDGQDVTQKFKNAGLYTTVGWVDVTAEVGGTWNSFRVQGISGSTNPNVSGVEVNGVQLLTVETSTQGTVLLTAQGTTMTDASDSNHTITTGGNAAIGSEFFNATYNSSGYWDFDGTGDNMVISRDDFTSAGNIDFAIESWFYFDTLPTLPTSKGYIWDQSPGAGGVAFRASTAGDLTTFAYPTGGGGVVLTNSGVAIQTGRWYHAVSVFETDKVSLYVDGVLANVTNGTISSVAPVGEVDFFIGSAADSGTGSEWMDGRIGEFRIYDRALTEAAVFQNYNATKSKYINEAPDTAPKISSDGYVIDNNLLLNYDFGNRATYDPAQNEIRNSTKFDFSTVNTVKTLNAAKAPDGTMTAAKIERGSTGSSTWYLDFVSAISANNAGTYTYSVWLRGPDGFTGGARIALLEQTGGNTEVSVNLTDQWQQYFVTKTYDGTFSTNIRVHPVIFRNQPGAIDAGKVVPDFVYMWQPQLEKASTTGRHVPTYGSAITAPTTVKNLSSSSYTGTINGATFNSAGYFDLDGTNDYISLGTQSFITTQHSVEMWLNVGAAKEHYLFSFGYFDNTSALFYLDTNAQELVVTWRVGGVNQSPVQSGVYFTTNQWRHVIWTRNGATNKIYVNGVEEASSTTQTTASLPACIYDIGWATTRSKATAYTQGEIGEVRIYDDALTASEVLQNFNANRGKYGV